MPRLDGPARFVAAGKTPKHRRRITRRVETHEDEPDASVQLRARDDAVPHCLERVPGKRTAVWIGAIGIKERKERDRPRRVAGKRAGKPRAFEHDSRGHALNMVERVASRRRRSRGLPGAELQDGRENPRRRDQTLPTRPEQKRSGRALRPRDAARLGMSSEAFSRGPENFM